MAARAAANAAVWAAGELDAPNDVAADRDDSSPVHHEIQSTRTSQTFGDIAV